jgi:hypothetical protein
MNVKSHVNFLTVGTKLCNWCYEAYKTLNNMTNSIYFSWWIGIWIQTKGLKNFSWSFWSVIIMHKSCDIFISIKRMYKAWVGCHFKFQATKDYLYVENNNLHLWVSAFTRWQIKKTQQFWEIESKESIKDQSISSWLPVKVFRGIDYIDAPTATQKYSPSTSSNFQPQI